MFIVLMALGHGLLKNRNVDLCIIHFYIGVRLDPEVLVGLWLKQHSGGSLWRREPGHIQR